MTYAIISFENALWYEEALQNINHWDWGYPVFSIAVLMYMSDCGEH